MSNGLEKLVGGVGKAIEVVPDIYDDGLKPTAQESGKTLALIPRTINAALVPLRQWIAEREYKLAETEKLIAQRLADIPPERIVTPETYVAVPAIQAISYSMNSEELRNLYANLLAKSMNIDTKDLVHPSFVEIIKQLSPIDAMVFSLIVQTDIKPLIDLRIILDEKEGGGGISKIKNISWITSFTHNQYSVSIDNLERLKLIEIINAVYTHDEHYKLVTETPTYISNRSALQNSLSGGQTIEDVKKIMEVSSLGELFYNVCVINNTTSDTIS